MKKGQKDQVKNKKQYTNALCQVKGNVQRPCTFKNKNVNNS